jgi:hypothetical protein
MKVALPVAAFAHMGIAHATLITFDDLPPPLPGDFFNSPVTDQYLSKGLLVDEAFLTRDSVTMNQSLFGTQFMHLTFVNTLPTFVSLSVSSALQDQVYLTAGGPGGFTKNVTTSGYGGPFNSTPYKPDELVSFANPGGISSIYLSSFYFTRVDPLVDNLYFGSVPAVPEPSTLMLMSVGVAMLIAVSRRRQRKS